MLPLDTIAGSKVTFTPRISFDLEFTDNVNLDTRGNEQSDVILVITPGFDFEASEKSRGLILSYDPGYASYRDFDIYNAWRHTGRLTAWTQISTQTQLRLTDVFRMSEDPITIEDYTLRRGRERYLTNSLDLTADHQLDKSRSLKLGYFYYLLENKDPNIEDSSRYNPSIGYSHRFSRYLSLDTTVDYNYGEFSGPTDDFNNWEIAFQLSRKFTEKFSLMGRYKHVFMNYKGLTEDFQIFDPSIGINYIISEGSAVRFFVGYFYRDRDISKDDSDISFDGDIGKTWEFKRGSVGITGTAGYDYAYFTAQNLGYNTFAQVSARGAYQFTRYLGGEITGYYRRTEYPDLDVEREDDRRGVRLNFILTPRIRWLPISISAGYEYIELDSTRPEVEYYDSRVLFKITTEKAFTKPIRLN
jgi:hypothetical protein